MLKYFAKTLISAFQYVGANPKVILAAIAILGLTAVALPNEASADPICWIVPGFGVVCF